MAHLPGRFAMVDFSIPGMAPFRIKQARNSARRENPSDFYDLIRLVSGKTLLRVVLCAWCSARGALRVVLCAWLVALRVIGGSARG